MISASEGAPGKSQVSAERWSEGDGSGWPVQLAVGFLLSWTGCVGYPQGPELVGGCLGTLNVPQE